MKNSKLSVPLRKFVNEYSVIIGYCINTRFYDRSHVSDDALPSLRGNALPRHERGHKMLYTVHVYLMNNLDYYIRLTHIKLTGIMLIRDRNSFNYIYI